MEFELMHRTVRVCSLDIDEWDGGILGVSDIGRPEHMPRGPWSRDQDSGPN